MIRSVLFLGVVSDGTKSFPIPVSVCGTEILGIPVGREQFVTEKCVKVAESSQELCSKLADLNDPQCSSLILRHCHVPRLNHLARAIRPYRLAVVHDNTRATYVDIIHLRMISGLKLF